MYHMYICRIVFYAIYLHNVLLGHVTLEITQVIIIIVFSHAVMCKLISPP